jgi:hypothetical protein
MILKLFIKIYSQEILNFIFVKFFLVQIKINFFNSLIKLFFLFFYNFTFIGCAFPCKECDINGKCKECFGN